MKGLKIIAGILVLVLVAIQFIPDKMPGNRPIGNEDITNNANMPPDVMAILKNSCFDCHSYQTNFPWYSKVAPSSWLLAKDINAGRKELNFSEWGNYSKRHKIGKLEAIREEVSSGEMPIANYTFIHRGAKLTPEQVSVLSKWTEDMTDQLMK